MSAIIEVENIIHHYGDFEAIHDLSFQVHSGEVFGLLGPNGAGKTTTIRLLNGMFEVTSGTLRVMDFDPAREGMEIRRRAGVLTETPALYERLTARQNLRFFGILAGMSDVDIQTRSEELLELFDLADRADEKTAAYSKGMKQRLALARAWLANPGLLFLDEPTSGLDPEAAVKVREMIADVRQKEGTTVLICTHNLDEAQRLCDRLLIMGQGRSLASGSLPDLRKLVSSGMWLEVGLQQPADVEGLRALAGVLNLTSRDERNLIVEVGSEAIIPSVVAWLVNIGARVLRVRPQEISLEEVYLKLQDKLHRGGAQ